MVAYVTDDDDGGNIEHFLKNKKETNANMSVLRLLLAILYDGGFSS